MSDVSQTKLGDPSFQRLLSCLEQIRHKLDSRQDEFQFLCNYFHSKDFWKLLKIHSTVSYTENGKPSDVNESAVDLADELVVSLIPHARVNKEIQELQHILTKPHFKGLLQAHDSIQAADFSSVIYQDEITVEPVLTNLGTKPASEDGGKIITVENYKTEKNGTEVYNNNDTSDDEAATDNYCHDNYEAEDIDEADGNKIKDDSDKESGSFADNGNDNTDLLWWDMPMPNNQLTASQPHVADHTLVSEEQISEEAKDIPVPGTDDKDTHNRDIPLATDDNKDKDIPIIVKNGISGKHIKEKECIIERNNVDGMMVQASNNAVKTVTMFRNSKETLGITVKAVQGNEFNKERIIVARILSGGLADNFASLYVDDEILEINDRRVEGMTANEVAEIMDGITGSIDIKVLPAKKDRKLTRETKVSLRAFFDYNPLQDPLIPCKEVGISFSAGDVLHVVNMDDANWWQARKDGCSHDKAGLIPSKDYQEKRQQLNRISSLSDVTTQKDKNGKHTSPFKRIRRKADSNKVLCNFVQDIPMDGWPAYEPVAKYLERPEKKRLLLLIGAPGVGRNEIKKMLLSGSPDRFTTTIPHTSRHMKSYEADGKDYFFVSRQTMENFIQKKKFIEFGEYKGCLYGTSKDSIKRALKTRKTCVLKVQPEVMLLLRTAEFKPYCVFVKPPPLKELRTSRLTVQAKNKPASDKSSVRTFKEEELQEMISTSRMLEETYGRFFDLTVVNKDIEEAYVSIVDTVENLEQEEQWVPLDWAQQN